MQIHLSILTVIITTIIIMINIIMVIITTTIVFIKNIGVATRS